MHCGYDVAEAESALTSVDMWFSRRAFGGKPAKYALLNNYSLSQAGLGATVVGVSFLEAWEVYR